MSRFHLVCLTALIALITACQPISGKLTVTRKLALELIEQDRQTNPGCLTRDDDCGDPVVRRVSASFHPGTYDAHLDIDAADAIQLTVEDGTYREAVVKVAIPEDVHLPRTSGRFALTAAETGQPFDMSGLIEPVESSSPVTAGWERCYLKIERRVCRHSKKTGKKHKHRRRCRYEYETVYGHRAVEFHHTVKTLTVNLGFNADTSGEALARFNGSATRKYTVYDYRGFCDVDNIFVHQTIW